ncbi:Hypothetical predicted protein [Olea europaea subsp. europaea]|uniref:Myb/SANT-like domain-containing protein n=1 Tax=Olea europaea subsp. europaea TaxID=158383 RepID=A0A8S0SEV0_OLEEU|nr:Hypothetical predicted protein [Olea europaea subsp. europaea]
MGYSPQQASFSSPEAANEVGSRRNAKWKQVERMTFIAACEATIVENHWHGRCFTKHGWDNVVTLFNSSSDYDWSKQQLRNHWDTMRRDHKRLSELLSCNGVKYDPSTGRVVASKEWWTRKIRLSLWLFGRQHMFHFSVYLQRCVRNLFALL